MAAWEIARRHPKWEPIQLVDFAGPTAPKKKAGPSKRSKTSESGTYTTSTDGLSSNMPEMNLNDDPVDEPEEDDTPTRPTPTRKKSGESVKDKLAVVADSVTEYKSARLLEMNESKLRKEKALESKIQRNEEYVKYLHDNAKNKDLKIILEPHEQLPEPTRSILLQRKQEICAKWGWAPPS